MSVQLVTPNIYIVHDAPIRMTPCHRLLSFATTGKVVHDRDVGAGFTGSTPTLWSYYWTSPEQNFLSYNSVNKNC